MHAEAAPWFSSIEIESIRNGLSPVTISTAVWVELQP